MAALPVEVKWGKEVYKNVPLDMSLPPQVFKEALYALSNVHPDRQKGPTPAHPRPPMKPK